MSVFRLGLTCNNRCIFCAQEGLRESPRDSLASLRAQGDEVTLVGGEPALSADFVEVVAQARALGFRSIGLQTNGTQLAERAVELARAGLTNVQVSLHGAIPAAHDYHTGVEGSFTRLLTGVAAARAAGLTVLATTLVTRSNFRGLEALARLLHQRGASAWLMAVPAVAGRAAAAFDRVVPRLGLALPFALHAAALAHQRGLPVFLQGAPLCLLGPFAEWALPSPSRTYGAVCENCEARPRCPGVDGRYLVRFDGDELRACAAVEPLANPLARLFAGPGELASAAAEGAASSPRAARRQLPLYGKVAPAAREVSPAEPKKSGEALRELFPTLFEKK